MWRGQRFVAVRNKLYYSDKRKFFGDFLRDHVPHIFGKEWFDNEVAKPEAERHPVIQWRSQGARYMNAQPPQPDGSRAARPTGALAAYMGFAYDLFVVEDNGELDDALLHRLKNRDTFQGARHELFAEATCLRASFTVQHENEKDGACRHTEFTAKHTATGQLLSIEAKSKHRAGVLAMPGTPQPHDRVSLRFGELINDAVAKKPPYPLVIFIDTNLPSRAAEKLYEREAGNAPSRLMQGILERTKKEHNDVDPYSMIVFSNHPHHYAVNELDPQKHLLSVVSQEAARREAGINHRALWSLHQAANLYGNVPNEFPDDNGKRPTAVASVSEQIHRVRYDFTVSGTEVTVVRDGQPSLREQSRQSHTPSRSGEV